MKENEFLDGMSNIDADVIERFVNMDNKLQSRSRRSRSVWLRVLALAACVALVIGVIATVVIFNRSKPVNYIIYADSVYAEELDEMLMGDIEETAIEVKNVNEKDFSFLTNTKKTESKDAEKTYELKVGEKEYELNYSKTKKKAEAEESRKMKAFSEYHVYVNVTAPCYLEINASTNEVTNFSDGNVSLSAGSLNFSKDEAKEKAADIIEQLYGKDTLDSYQYYDTIITDGQSQTSYTAVYMRDVWDLKNEDKISVTFNKDGEFFGINANNKGTLEKAEKDLSKKEIENAIAKLNDTFSDEWNIQEPSLIRDVNGDYYIQCFIYRGANGDSKGTYVYINVQ